MNSFLCTEFLWFFWIRDNDQATKQEGLFYGKWEKGVVKICKLDESLRWWMKALLRFVNEFPWWIKWKNTTRYYAHKGGNIMCTVVDVGYE